MTRKDYEKFAEMFKFDAPAGLGDTVAGEAAQNVSNRAWAQAAEGAADIFARDNARFDRARFLVACGLLEG